ncbi:hypothetical protein Mycch_2211 [Mycolicibacterium chubuense NBB4]|uniref:Uncharacterized protein n=1 Tax=Mycolicibacterium chubuense (strain NBB4) TaxID=710421 RepID=I4BI87_MYCCN|nr:hypothetical protein [Mycolicibacterium chubuense]AFM16994.1 hypothetical protein Mycch_2211 [Mycolicibacterium chubuense NBB4]
MPTRTLDVALWDYRDQAGRKRRAHYRETFELPDSEVERGERAGVFTNEPTASAPPLPTKSSTNRELVDWLVERGDADRDEVKGLTKAQLWQRIETTEDVAAQ